MYLSMHSFIRWHYLHWIWISSHVPKFHCFVSAHEQSWIFLHFLFLYLICIWVSRSRSRSRSCSRSRSRSRSCLELVLKSYLVWLPLSVQILITRLSLLLLWSFRAERGVEVLAKKCGLTFCETHRGYVTIFKLEVLNFRCSLKTKSIMNHLNGFSNIY